MKNPKRHLPSFFFIVFVNLIIYKCGQSLSADFVIVL